MKPYVTKAVRYLAPVTFAFLAWIGFTSTSGRCLGLGAGACVGPRGPDSPGCRVRGAVVGGGRSDSPGGPVRLHGRV